MANAAGPDLPWGRWQMGRHLGGSGWNFVEVGADVGFPDHGRRRARLHVIILKNELWVQNGQ